MTKKIKRNEDFEIEVTIKNADFIRPPREAQRNALLNAALNEFSWNLSALNNLASKFVRGTQSNMLSNDRTQKVLLEEEIMEDWQIPVALEMAKAVTESRGDILEIGFGNGISSTAIQEYQVHSHTIIECNDSIVRKFDQWKQPFDRSNINLVHGLWQETIDDLELFDGILFHTYPLNTSDYVKYVQGRVTFAEHFFETASNHLRPGGTFTYFSNEIDSLSRSHQRSLFRCFSSFSLKVIELELPKDVEDTWWADSIVIVKAVK